METTRLNRRYLFVGDLGTGKTSVCYEFAKAFMDINNLNKTIIVDTDPHPFYNDFTTVNLDTLKHCNDALIRCEDANEDELFTTLNKHQRNAFVVFEDAAKYISPNISKAVKTFIIDHRKRNFDVAFMFHFLSEVPPYIASCYTHLILFKTNDDAKNNYTKFPNWATIKTQMLALKKSKDHHAFKVITK